MKRGAAPAAALARLEAARLYRRRATVTAFLAEGERALLELDGTRLVDFSSNDYLGLARHPELARAMSACAAASGAGSAASHLVCGHGREHARLEEELAAFCGRERALLFSSGYMANLAVVTAFAGRGERVLLDRLAHASLIDGAQLSGAKLTRYAHADAAAAARELAAPGAPAVLVATDGVFSMDGDLAPLPELARAARASDAWLIVDDAHGLGVIGATGRGSLEHFALGGEEVPLLVGTLGKAFGSFGAFIAGERALIDYLVQKARPYIYTTALPQPVAAASRVALALAAAEGWRRARLAAHITSFRARALAGGVPLAESSTPIQPVLLGGAATALAVQEQLRSAGFHVVAIRPPTVPPGTARLRVTLTAAHSEEQVASLAAHLAQACESLRELTA